MRDSSQPMASCWRARGFEDDRTAPSFDVASSRAHCGERSRTPFEPTPMVQSERSAGDEYAEVIFFRGRSVVLNGAR